jgi:predicted metal-dependent phosphoesterase TrpH
VIRVDLHFHTTRYSKCSRTPVERLIEISPDLEIEALTITEHDVLWSADEIQELQHQLGDNLRIFRAVEVTTDVGDVLTYNLSDDRDIRKGMPFEELAEYARIDGAALVLAHPGRYISEVPANRSAAWDQISAVEAMSNNIHESQISNVRQAVSELGRPTVAGSDAHDDFIIGLYATQFPRMPEDEADLAKMIISGVGIPWADTARVQQLRLDRPDRPILLTDPTR